MKLFLTALCLVAVSARPDDLIKLMDPNIILSSAAQAIAAPSSTAAPTESKSPEFPTKQGTTADRTRLLSNLFTGYNKKVNPDGVKLQFGVALINFNVCEKKNIFESYVWLRYVWEDPRLKWSPEDYGGAEVLRLDSAEVWKPDVTLYNSADPVNMVNCWNSNVLLYATGKILWVPPCKMISQCHLTLRVHPYDEQTCSLKFGSWTFDGNVLDIDFYNKTSTVDISDLNNSSGYEILSTSGVRTDKHYPCCEEAYPDLTFNITVKRIPGDELFKKI